MPQLVLPVLSTCPLLDISLEIINAHQYGFTCNPGAQCAYNLAFSEYLTTQYQCT